jgi:DNA-binding transcriptional MerR regulator
MTGSGRQEEETIMARAAEKNRTLYLDVDDTTKELGITPRQLRYWEESDLLQPELGRNRYTEQDLARLWVIKRFVVDEGFPVDVVRRLFERQLWDDKYYDDVTGDRARSGELTNLVLDLDSGSLVQRDEMFKRLWNEFLETAEERELEAQLEQLVLVYFRLIRQQSRTPAKYVGETEEILSRIQELSQLARLEEVYGDDDQGPGPLIGVRLEPLLPGETETKDDLKSLFKRNQAVVLALQEAGRDLAMRARRRFNGQDRLSGLSDLVEELLT